MPSEREVDGVVGTGGGSLSLPCERRVDGPTSCRLRSSKSHCTLVELDKRFDRRSERDHLAHPMRNRLRDLARVQPAEAPSDERRLRVRSADERIDVMSERVEPGSGVA